MEAYKEAGWKAKSRKIKGKPQNIWFNHECETEKEKLQSLGENISNNIINNSELRQPLRDKKKRFKQTCRKIRVSQMRENISLGIWIAR